MSHKRSSVPTIPEAFLRYPQPGTPIQFYADDTEQFGTRKAPLSQGRGS